MKTTIYILAILLFCLVGTTYAQYSWDFVEPMPEPRSEICGVALDGKIYVVGGADTTGNALNSMVIYDPNLDFWQSSASMLTARKNAAAVVKNDTIFVLGGRNGADDIENSVEYFTPTNNEWLPFQSILQNREALAAVIINNTIYALGGFTQVDGFDMLLDTVEFFNTSTSRWEPTNNWQLQEGLALFSAVNLDNGAYVIGGFSTFGPLDLVQIFQSEIGTSSEASLNIPRGGHAAAVRADSILVIGGRNSSDEVIGSVEIFQKDSGVWNIDEEQLRQGRENFAAVTIDRYSYVMGGKDVTGKILASVETKTFQPAITSVVSEAKELPEAILLKQNYPNPFNPSSTITFSIPNANAMTDLSIYNLQGRLVKNLVHKKISAGEHRVQWNGQDILGNDVASGIYIYIITQGNLKISKKMLLVR